MGSNAKILKGVFNTQTDMTGRELIKWILDHHAENKYIRIQYRDSGGDYEGTDNALYLCEAREEDLDSYRWQRDVIVL